MCVCVGGGFKKMFVFKSPLGGGYGGDDDNGSGMEGQAGNFYFFLQKKNAISPFFDASGNKKY